MGSVGLKGLGGVLLACGIALALAFLFTWSARFCEMHNADSILPAIISTQNVTFYHWGQNRFGNLLPFLAAWISDIDLNLQVQVFLRALCAAAGVAFWLLILGPKAILASYAAALFAIIALERASLAHSYWTDDLPYGTSLAILAFSVWVAGRSSWRLDVRVLPAAAAVFMLLMAALWVNLAAPLLVLPLFVGCAVLNRSRSYGALALLSLMAYGVVAAHAAYVVGGPEYAVLRPSWALTELAAANLAAQVRPLPALLFGAAVAWSLWLLRRRWDIGRTALVIFGSALLAGLVTANVHWVQINESLPRYFVLPVTAVIATGAVLIVEAVSMALAPARWSGTLVRLAAMTLLIAAAAIVLLPLNPSCGLAKPRAGVDEIAGLAVRTGAAFVDGDYWMVWPAVRLANRGASAPVFGLTFRGVGARAPVRKYLEANPHPVVLCVETPLPECIGHLDDVVGARAQFKGSGGGERRAGGPQHRVGGCRAGIVQLGRSSRPCGKRLGQPPDMSASARSIGRQWRLACLRLPGQAPREVTDGTTGGDYRAVDTGRRPTRSSKKVEAVLEAHGPSGEGQRRLWKRATARECWRTPAAPPHHGRSADRLAAADRKIISATSRRFVGAAKAFAESDSRYSASSFTFQTSNRREFDRMFSTVSMAVIIA